ncbi:MAG: L,D-transpeptidase family protein [Amphritea sp.]
MVWVKAIRMYVYLLVLMVAVLVSHALAGEYSLHRQDSMIGSINIIHSRYQDTLLDIAHTFNIGYNEIIRANPDVDIWLPGEGTEVLIPQLFVLPNAPWKGIVLNLSERRLYYFPQHDSTLDATRRVFTFPVGIGREGWNTPVGKTSIVSKIANPSWTPPQSIREEALLKGIVLPDRVDPGPDNPLGEYALNLGIPRYLLHGTNKPDGIGMRVSHGCIRLFPDDIKTLYDSIDIDTPVWIIDQPDKAGWLGQLLYLESHPAGYKESISNEDQYLDEIWRVLPNESIDINWSLAEQVHRRANGVPTVIGRRLSAAQGSDDGEFQEEVE